MKLRLETRHRLLVIATGDDAGELDNCDQGDDETMVAGAASADLTQAAAPEIDPRVEPEDRGRKRAPRIPLGERVGFTA